MTDFRALCAELADELQGYKVSHPMHCRALLNRARAALAQPEPQGLTDEELWELYDEMGGVPEDSAWCLNYARAVLARWGRPAIEPVPVSDRLPGPEDCDAEGRCWFGTPGSHVMAANWVFRMSKDRRSWDTHWLPHHALPVPQQEGSDD
jgi:hypothetical protein